MQTSCETPNLIRTEQAPQHVTAEWFAVQTRPRHEKVVASHLQTSGVEAFLPLCPEVRTWSDRRKVVEFPLFPGYVFVLTAWFSPARVQVLESSGALGFVGPRNRATPIPAEQIEAVRCLIQAKAGYRPHHYLSAGQRVRIRDGALQGLQGILVSVSNDHSLVISVDLIHRSVAVQLKGYEVEPL